MEAIAFTFTFALYYIYQHKMAAFIGNQNKFI